MRITISRIQDRESGFAVTLNLDGRGEETVEFAPRFKGQFGDGGSADPQSYAKECAKQYLRIPDSVTALTFEFPAPAPEPAQ